MFLYAQFDRNNTVKYVMNFKVCDTLITEDINTLYHSVDILDMLFSDRLSYIVYSNGFSR